MPANGDCFYHTILAFFLGRNVPAGHPSINLFRQRLIDLAMENQEKLASETKNGPHLIDFAHARQKTYCCHLYKDEPDKTYHQNFDLIYSSKPPHILHATNIEEWAECHRKEKTWGDNKILSIIAGLTGFSFFSYQGIDEDNEFSSPFWMYNSETKWGWTKNIPGGEVIFKFASQHYYGLIIPPESRIPTSVLPYEGEKNVQPPLIDEEKIPLTNLEKKPEILSSNKNNSKRMRRLRMTDFFPSDREIKEIGPVRRREKDPEPARKKLKNFNFGKECHSEKGFFSQNLKSHNSASSYNSSCDQPPETNENNTLLLDDTPGIDDCERKTPMSQNKTTIDDQEADGATNESKEPFQNNTQMLDEEIVIENQLPESHPNGTLRLNDETKFDKVSESHPNNIEMMNEETAFDDQVPESDSGKTPVYQNKTTIDDQEVDGATNDSKEPFQNNTQMLDDEIVIENHLPESHPNGTLRLNDETNLDKVSESHLNNTEMMNEETAFDNQVPESDSSKTPVYQNETRFDNPEADGGTNESKENLERGINLSNCNQAVDMDLSGNNSDCESETPSSIYMTSDSDMYTFDEKTDYFLDTDWDHKSVNSDLSDISDSGGNEARTPSSSSNSSKFQQQLRIGCSDENSSEKNEPDSYSPEPNIQESNGSIVEVEKLDFCKRFENQENSSFHFSNEPNNEINSYETNAPDIVNSPTPKRTETEGPIIEVEATTDLYVEGQCNSNFDLKNHLQYKGELDKVEVKSVIDIKPSESIQTNTDIANKSTEYEPPSTPMHIKSKLPMRHRICNICNVKVDVKFFRKHLNKFHSTSDFDAAKLTTESVENNKHTLTGNAKLFKGDNHEKRVICSICQLSIVQKFYTRHLKKNHTATPKQNGDSLHSRDCELKENEESFSNGGANSKDDDHCKENYPTVDETSPNDEIIKENPTIFSFKKEENDPNVHNKEKNGDSNVINDGDDKKLHTKVQDKHPKENVDHITSNDDSRPLEKEDPLISDQKENDHDLGDKGENEDNISCDEEDISMDGGSKTNKENNKKKYKKQKYKSLDLTVVCRVEGCNKTLLNKNYKRHLQKEHGLSDNDLRPKNQKSIGQIFAKNTHTDETQENCEGPTVSDQIDSNCDRTNSCGPGPEIPTRPIISDKINSNSDNENLCGSENQKQPAWAKSFEDKVDHVDSKVDHLESLINKLQPTTPSHYPKREYCQGLDRARTFSEIQKECPFYEVEGDHIQCKLCIKRSSRAQFEWKSS